MTDFEKHGFWKITTGNSPLVAAAIHDGHEVRKEVAEILALTSAERRREEDPFTGRWTTVAATRITGRRSRFEVDLNRPRQKAVYIEPEDAWGLHVWREKPSPEIIARSLVGYDAFYARVRSVLTDLVKRFGCFVVFDLHSYNHRRGGASAPPADAAGNPEVNIGTGTVVNTRWRPLIDRFIDDLRNYDFLGRRLDVRENIKFQGGQFSRWIHESFPDSGCSLAIEFKKFFMDEWSGKPDDIQVDAIRRALQYTIPGVLGEIQQLHAS
ncbi:MAG: N-formylglutamate amidohydrolase [Candidatus Poribacteria bacterium]|nr:N-formylglutamate amidohydrolase [Candidatus Poribacteria bacterium]